MYVLLIPNFNDGKSLAQLIAAIDTCAGDLSEVLDVVVVNDGGASCAPDLQPPQNIRQIHEFSLVVNFGHQRAIAVGLAELAFIDQYEAVIVMDGDGEDRPADVFKLIGLHKQQPDRVIVGSRAVRSEDLKFRLFYRLYQMIFRVLIGKVIDFGNFMLLPAGVVSSIVYNPNLWNHLAATILSSSIPIYRLRVSRGKRYAGKTKMNFEKLVTHGLSAMSVYLTTMFTRMLIALSGLLSLTIIGIGVVVCIRYLTDLAIPGWATNLVGILLIIIFQLLLLLLVSAFATLNQRSSPVGIPVSIIRDYIKTKKIIF